MKTLIMKGIIKLISGILLMGMLLFIPAGTMEFPGAWRMLFILFIPMLIVGTGLLIKSPKLLEKRLGSNEQQKDQKLVILGSSLMFIACFVISGLDYRFGWTKVPTAIVMIAGIVFVTAYLGFIELLRENEYLSRTVEVQDGQQVVSTGLYGIVRHPMYFIITFMYLSIPLIIGSFAGLLPLVFWPVIISKRIENEEKVLEEGLAGYTEYKQKVRCRMIPFIW